MNTLTISKTNIGCLEKFIIIDGTNKLCKFTLSNNLDDIRTAIFARTGCNINLDKAKWSLNPKLSMSVKHMMNNHQVKFSMTTDTKLDGKTKFVVINMRTGGLWFITGFDEIGGDFYCWEDIRACKRIVAYIDKWLAENDVNSDEND